MAQAFPRPWLAAQTMALRPRNPRSMCPRRMLLRPQRDLLLVGECHAGGLGAPHAKARRLKPELAWAVRCLILDFIDAHRIFENHPVWSFEIEEAGPRRRMAPRAEHDRHAPFVEEVVGAQHVVAALDLVIDVLDAGLRGADQRDGVMDGVDAHQRDVADSIADAGVADLGPESLVARRIGRVEADVAEACDTRVAACEV